MVRLVDAFVFYNELDLLEFRLETLYEVVDSFILVEATHTHSGVLKPLYFEENKDRFQRFQDKLIHVIVRDFPFQFPNIDYSKEQQWENEKFQRVCIERGLTDVKEVKDVKNVWISICDLDEVPDPKLLEQLKKGNLRLNAKKVYSLGMDFYYYDLTHYKGKWHLGKIMSLETFQAGNWKEIRALEAEIIPKAGWHLSYFGDAKFISNKIKNFAYQEFAHQEYTSEENIRKRIEQNKDVFGRNESLEIIPLEKNEYLPPNFEKLNLLFGGVQQKPNLLSGGGGGVDKILEKNIVSAFEKAENNQSKLPIEILDMEGMSGIKTRHFYNNLLDMPDARYLEIGTWKGSSVCFAMYGNHAKTVCIDNWSEFGGPRDEFLSNFEKYKGDNDASFIEQDCFQVDTTKLPKFNIFMYDGNHTTESHYKALLHYYNCLDDIFIFIVDDWNWECVRQGTLEAIKALNLKVLYKKELRLTWNNEHTPQPQAKDTWWNGIYIAILEKTPALDVQVVIAHYNEDLDWVKNLKYKYTIISKNNIPLETPPNKGYEASSYLEYIIQHYNNLATFTIFIHGHQTSWHCQEKIDEKINKLIFDKNYYNINDNVNKENLLTNAKGIVDTINQISEQIEITDLFYKQAAQFYVHKDNILRHSKETYQKWYDVLINSKHNSGWTSRAFEYCWHYIFTGNPVDESDNVKQLIVYPNKVIPISNQILDNFVMNNQDYLVDNEYYENPSGNQEYRLYSYLSTFFNDAIILDIGTNTGRSAIALSHNPRNQVISYNIIDAIKMPNHKIYTKSNITFRIEDFLTDPKITKDFIKQVKIVMIDIDHYETIEWEMIKKLKELDFSGLILLDDITNHPEPEINRCMNRLWNRIKEKYPNDTYDMTKYGHWSGTGLIRMNTKIEFSFDNQVDKKQYIPIIIICHNNYKYVENTVRQIKNKENIIIMDNASTCKNTINFLKNSNCKVIYNETNNGPWIESNPKLFNNYDKFIITDPDLEFNPNLPENYIEILNDLSEKYQCGKIGFALDISDFDDMFQGKYSNTTSIYENEKQFWMKKIEHHEYELYEASIDTTFCLVNKKYGNNIQIRIAGNFTAKHLPWYKKNKIYNLYQNYMVNSMFSRIISTTSNIIISYIENNYLKIEKRKELFLIQNHDDKNIDFWKKIFVNWENDTFAVFDTYLTQDKDFIDIGGWIGTTSMYGSRKSKHVYCIEADSLAFKDMKRNMEINCESNYTLINKAIYNQDNTISFFGLIKNYNINPNNISLIKVDIEGGEEYILDDLFSFYFIYKIPMYISFHYDWWKDKNLNRFSFLTKNQKESIYNNPFISLLIE
jgi:beta-1,4-mannosyl-glycoprotein beta-1,4-N-acetylglucosaminyltransferase